MGRIVQIGLRSDASEARKRASEDAQHELIQKNLKLVVSIAKGFHWGALTLEEMTSDGNLGLIEAAARYNPFQFKTRFSTYATWWIQQAIRQGIQRSHTVRTPVRHARLLRQIRSCRSFAEDRADQDFEQLERESGIPKKRIGQILGTRCTCISLNAPQGDGDDSMSLSSKIESHCC